jgi:hypothetical protein
MYALLFPAAQRFISSVLGKVKLDVREIGSPTSAFTPWCCLPA